MTRSGRGWFGRRTEGGRLRAVGEHAAGGLLDTRDELVVVSWNVHKVLHAGCERELAELARDEDVDLFALQEARPDMTLPPGFGGHHATSYQRVGAPHPEGVMTASRADVLSAERLRSPSRELRVLTPKAALVSRYALRTGETLTVANVHGLNFDPRGKLLDDQLTEVARRVEEHEGPMIVTGDFNTWNEDRRRAADSLAARLGLVEVAPPEAGGTTASNYPAPVERALGLDPELHLDRMFVRGLRPVRAAWIEECVASDHVPLLARLEWA